MCGIVGMAGQIYNNEKKMFRDMLIFDTVRGIDSTGILAVRHNYGTQAKNYKDKGYEHIIAKEIGAPSNLWEFYNNTNLLDMNGFVNPHNIKLLLGHNRAATIGKINDETAHPHHFGKIIGVHNGTVPTYKTDLKSDLETDSMAIFDSINKEGIEEVWLKLYGAAVLIWWDTEAETLNFVRNGQRPLHMAESERGDVLFWASEPWMITIAADRQGVKLRELEDKKRTYPLPVDKHFQIELKGNNFHPEITKSVGLKSAYDLWDEWYKPGFYEVYKKPDDKKKTPTTEPVKQIEDKSNVIDLVDCVCCGNYFSGKDADAYVKEHNDVNLCKTCVEDPVVKHYFNLDEDDNNKVRVS